MHIVDGMQVANFAGIDTLSGYFSLRHGSGYDASENWFAVSLHDGTFRNTLTTMHEVMHIIFHKAWWKTCQKQGLPEKNIWDVKEAMTVLLNLWFKDVLIDLDWGYEEHAELRHLIVQWFLDSREFQTTLLKACEYIKQNPNKSPLWNNP